MKILKMRATFGKLQSAELALGEGLNVIEAPNEGGKSTWSAFLRAMLYGINTKERDRQGYLAEKNRYQPWSGAAMEGSVELLWQGRSVTLRRGPKGSTPFGRFEAVYTGTAEPVPGLTGDNAGETLTGVPREVFERSAFVGQGGAAIDGAPALEARIAALASSGEEDVSYSQVERRLRDWLNRRKHNKTGLIPRLEEELADVEETLARQSKAFRLAQEARRELERLQAEHRLLEKELCPIKDMENPELVRLLLVGEDPVYQIADNMPEFPRGMTACLQYLARNIKYPVIAQKEGAQGKVIVQMVIEKDGSVDHVSIVRSITPELDAEAARVVKSMPKWKPATVKDKAVRCRYTVPVTFKLQ